MSDHLKNITLPLSEEHRKKVNKSTLAAKHECSGSYVSRVLKSERFPTKGKAKAILNDAIKIIEVYNQQH
ncbi:hypothetical protein [Winogradskyella sp.]|uniref:hypothetical protein n=1 Tax=Winogradskyella sp. TaxID=1883156 RepID=UPI00323E535E